MQMKYSYQWLKDLVGFQQGVREIADVFNRFVFDTEVSGKNLEIKIQPNRVGDASGHFGVAKELGFVLKKTVRFPKTSYAVSAFKTSDFVELEVGEKNLCRRYTALYAKLPQLGKTPVWLKRRLMACGLRPINAVVDIMNYVMLEIGQPLHAFDFEKLAKTGAGKAKIIVRSSKKGETITTLEDKTYNLTGKELLICDLSGPLAVAGIKGGQRAEIDQKTRAIVVEAANFDAVSIRMTSRNLGIKTDASWRFENFLDPNLTMAAMQRAANLLQEIGAVEIADNFVDFYPKKTLPQNLKLSLAEIEKIIGFPVSPAAAEKIFRTFSANVKKISPDGYVLTVETGRQDIVLKEDVAEEVARLVGYDKIPAIPVAELVKAPQGNYEIELKQRVQDELVKFGFDEVMNYSLVKESDLSGFGSDKDSFIKVTKSVSGDYSYLRVNTAVGLLKNISENAKRLDRFKIFEIGHVFSQGQGLPKENIELGLAIFGNGNVENQFLELKGCLESLFERTGFGKVVFKKQKDNVGYEYLTFSLGNDELGYLINTQKYLLDKYDIKGPVAYAKISFDLLLSKNVPARQYQAVNKLPEVKRDLSFFLDKKIEYSAITDKINSPLLENFELFDIFEKNGKKSFSFHFYFRVKGRTLIDKEVDEEMKKIIAGLENLGAQIR